MTGRSPSRVDRPHSLTELAYQELRTVILSGGFEGDRPVSVVGLSAKLGMSRSPVRTACERLIAEGLLVQSSDGLGVPASGHEQLLKALAVRATLEGMAARLAAPRMDGSTDDRLAVLHRRFAGAVARRDRRAAAKADLAFHQAIQERSENELLVELLNQVQARVVLATYSIVARADQDAAVNEHAAILKALSSRDGAAAETAAVAHLDRLARRIRSR